MLRLEVGNRAAGKELAHLEGGGVDEPHVGPGCSPRIDLGVDMAILLESRISLSLAPILGDIVKQLCFGVCI